MRLLCYLLTVSHTRRSNSGVAGGKFLERGSVTNPSTGTVFRKSDLYVGAVIEVYRRKFVIFDADEYALNFMESDPESFPRSSIGLIARCVLFCLFAAAAVG
jgi:hypothetical protein